MKNFLRRVIWICTCLAVPTKGFSHTGNRTIYKGARGNKEVTIISKDISKPERYSREELVLMLKELRIHEEIQQWEVPEPVRCIHCGHCSPVDEDGFCPVPVSISAPPGTKVRMEFKEDLCGCSNHGSGLEEAWRASKNLRPLSHFTISPSEASSEALNG